MRTHTTFRAAAFLVPLAGALAACDSQGPGGPGTTSLTILLKDVPSNVQHAVVTITEVDLVGSGGVQVLTQVPTTTDLLTLATETATLVQDMEVPSGAYQELRFRISGACLAVRDAEGVTTVYATDGYDGAPCGGPATATLRAPSFGQSGLKVQMAGDALVLTGAEKTLLVDFDVIQSFGQEAGGSGWVMHPVITGAELEGS